MIKVLGIDYGRRHIGSAISESLFATPLVSGEIDSIDDAVLYVLDLIGVHKPVKIVLGIPEGEIAKDILEFESKLSKVTTIPVITHPETLSSQDAISKLREGGASRLKLIDDHAYAACLILEDYLDLYKVVY